MKPQHTPGPWFIDGDDVRSQHAGHPPGIGIATIRCYGSFEVHQSKEANARLIAAAPELLAALEAVYEAGTIAYAAAYCGKQPWPDDRREEFRINHCQADMLARAAIAKAKGQKAG